MRRTHNRKFEQKMFTLFPGEYYATSDDIIINTLLGSCIAVAIYDPVRQQGGMNHFLLPDNPGENLLGTAAGHYGINAMELLINSLLKAGTRKSNMICKVYGGGKIITAGSDYNGIHTANINFALSFLATEGLKIVAADVGGRYTRKVYFFSKTGKILLERQSARLSKQVIKEESKFISKIKKKEDDWGDMTFFDPPKR